MTTERVPELALRATAADQEAAFNHKQAIAAGFTQEQIEHRCESGKFKRHARGVYTIVGSPETFRQRLWVVWLAIRACVISHRSAAIVHDAMTAGDDEIVEVTVRRGRNHRSALATIHQRPPLKPSSITTKHGLLVTTLARTIADLAGRLTVSALEDMVDTAICSARASFAEIEAEQADMPRNDPGRAKLEVVLEAWRREGTPESKWEVKLARLLEANGVEGLVFQHELRDHSGRVVARFDVALPSWCIGIEYESFERHAARRDVVRTNRRRNAVQAYGWVSYGATKPDIDEGCVTLARQILDEVRRRSLAAS